MENNQFVTDPELTNYLNDSLSILDGILVSKFSDYKITKTIVSVNAGTNQISLPLDFVKFRGLDLWYNQSAPDGYCTMNEYGWLARNQKAYPTTGNVAGNISPYVYEYRLEGQYLTIMPTQVANLYQYRLNYTPDYIPLVNYTDTLQPYMDTQNWRQYAIHDCTAKIIAKQDMDPTFFQQQADMLKNHLITLATPNRNAGEPKGVEVGARGEGGGYPYGWAWIYQSNDISDIGELNALLISDYKWQKW